MSTNERLSTSIMKKNQQQVEVKQINLYSTASSNKMKSLQNSTTKSLTSQMINQKSTEKSQISKVPKSAAKSKAKKTFQERKKSFQEKFQEDHSQQNSEKSSEVKQQKNRQPSQSFNRNIEQNIALRNPSQQSNEKQQDKDTKKQVQFQTLNMINDALKRKETNKRDSFLTCVTLETEEIDEKVAYPNKMSMPVNKNRLTQNFANYYTPQGKLMIELDENARRMSRQGIDNGGLQGAEIQGYQSYRHPNPTSQNQPVKAIHDNPSKNNVITSYQNFKSKASPGHKVKVLSTEEINEKLDQSIKTSPSKHEVTNTYRELIFGSVDHVQEIINKKKQGEKVNQNLKKQLKLLQDECNNLVSVNINITDKIDNVVMKGEEIESHIDQLRIDIIKTNQERVNIRDREDSEIQQKQIDCNEIKHLLERIKQQQEVEKQNEKEELDDQRVMIRNLKIEIDQTKQTLDQFQSTIRKEKCIEQERMRQIKQGEQKLKIFFKQNQKTLHVDFLDDDEDAKQQKELKMRKSLLGPQHMNKSNM